MFNLNEKPKKRMKFPVYKHYFGGSYDIKKLQEQKAKKLGVSIKPSTRKNKKLDVFKDGKKIASIGGVRKTGVAYGDYATYIKTLGKKEADKKRKNYLARHSKEPKTKNGKKTNSYYADKILW